MYLMLEAVHLHLHVIYHCRGAGCVEAQSPMDAPSAVQRRFSFTASNLPDSISQHISYNRERVMTREFSIGGLPPDLDIVLSDVSPARRFRVHKAIVALESTVFAEMIEDCSRAGSGTVDEVG